MPAWPFSLSDVSTSLLNGKLRLAETDEGILADRNPKQGRRKLLF